jgi:hypothetical protein
VVQYYINGITDIWNIPPAVKDYLETTQEESVLEWKELFLVYNPTKKLEKYLSELSSIIIAGYSTESNLMVDRQKFGNYVAIVVWRPQREKSRPKKKK